LKKAIALALLLALILPVSACRVSGKAAEDLARSVRDKVKSASAVTLSLDVRADYVDRVYDFSFTYSGDGKTGEITVTAPESIAGLKAHFSESGGRLEYDGVFLDTGPITWDGLSPAEAVPLLLDQWREGYISSTTFEKLDEADTLVLSTDVSDTVTQRTWFDRETLLPLRAEISENGRLILTCTFTQASFEASTQ